MVVHLLLPNFEIVGRSFVALYSLHARWYSIYVLPEYHVRFQAVLDM